MGRRETIRQKAVALVNELLEDTGRDYSTSSESGLYGFLQRHGYQWNGQEWAQTYDGVINACSCSDEQPQAQEDAQAPNFNVSVEVYVDGVLQQPTRRVNETGPEIRPITDLEPFERWLKELEEREE